MEKIISMIMAILIISMVGSVAAENEYNVDSYLEIDGNCTIDRDLLAQTEYGYEGQRLTEHTYSRWMAIRGVSDTSYKSDLNIHIGTSETQENVNTSKIKYTQTAFTTNTHQKVTSQNYDAGAMVTFKTIGRSGKAFKLEMMPDKNYLELEGGIEGKATLNHMVVDPDSRMKIVRQTTRLEGLFNIAWIEDDERLLCDGDKCDWLGCP